MFLVQNPNNISDGNTSQENSERGLIWCSGFRKAHFSNVWLCREGKRQSLGSKSISITRKMVSTGQQEDLSDVSCGLQETPFRQLFPFAFILCPPSNLLMTVLASERSQYQERIFHGSQAGAFWLLDGAYCPSKSINQCSNKYLRSQSDVM